MTGITATGASPHARLHAVSPAGVEMLDGFWRDRVEANRTAGVPRLAERLEEHGVVDNFRPAAGAAPSSGADGGGRRGLWFTDSDLYKWMEAAAWSLGWYPDPALEARLDELIDVVVAAQQPDGYLNTNFTAATRLRDLSWSHELYCAGHLFQAAVARHRMSGDDRLLRASTRFADLLVDELGPGRRAETDGHPGVEMALVELYRETREPRYLELATTLVGRVDSGTPATLAGHAVRAAYFAAGLADLALETGDLDLLDVLDRLWTEMTDARSYVTGGLGGRWIGEAVGRDYELPNEGAYAETCAGVAVAQWAWRMLARTGEARFADRLELVLHNAFLAGVSLGADEWFYANPLAATGEPEPDPWASDTFAIDMAGPFPLRRRPWRDVTCCPPNAARMLASLPGYLYGETETALWVHLYAASRVTAAGLRVTQHTAFPWDGRVELVVEPAGDDAPLERSVVLRIPGWSRAPAVAVNGVPWPVVPTAGTYLELHGRWSAGDRVTLDLDLVTTPVRCNPRVAENRASVALVRGPLVYCLESPDNPGIDVLQAALVTGGDLASEHRPDLLGGVTTVRGPGRVPVEPYGPLYRPVDAAPPPESDVTLTAIPYFAWANRRPSRMTVWMRRT